MARPILRHWCAECSYPGRKPFLFGAVQADSEMAALRAASALWASISPHPEPSMTMLPGLLAFQSDENLQ